MTLRASSSPYYSMWHCVVVKDGMKNRGVSTEHRAGNSMLDGCGRKRCYLLDHVGLGLGLGGAVCLPIVSQHDHQCGGSISVVQIHIEMCCRPTTY